VAAAVAIVETVRVSR